MVEKVPQDVVLRSLGAMCRDSDAYRDLEKALKTGDPGDWLAARTSFDKLVPTMRERIRHHAESYAKLLRDD